MYYCLHKTCTHCCQDSGWNFDPRQVWCPHDLPPSPPLTVSPPHPLLLLASHCCPRHTHGQDLMAGTLWILDCRDFRSTSLQQKVVRVDKQSSLLHCKTELCLAVHFVLYCTLLNQISYCSICDYWDSIIGQVSITQEYWQTLLPKVGLMSVFWGWDGFTLY